MKYDEKKHGSETDHSPRPWTLDTTTGIQMQTVYLVESNGDLVATVNGDADASLIVSAPELLQALKVAEATLERLAPGGERATQGTRDVIRAAIARAEGKAGV